MKWDMKKHLFAFAMILVAAAAAIYFSPLLPDPVPSHFNVEGAPDKWSPKSEVILVGVGAPAAIFVILTFIPLIDPFWRRIQGKYDLFLILRDIAVGAVVYFTVVTYFSAMSGSYASTMTGLGFGLTFMFLGNYLPKLPRNFFFGIRSPWTLASEEVWKRTHRVSGVLFVFAGVVIAVLAFLPLPLHIVLLSVLLPLVLFCAIVYPYTLYRKLERKPRERLPQL